MLWQTSHHQVQGLKTGLLNLKWVKQAEVMNNPLNRPIEVTIKNRKKSEQGFGRP